MGYLQLGRVLGESAIIGGDDYAPDDVVKSAGRVFRILELLDIIGREAVVSEISEVLNVPQSSTSMLLRSMEHLGYLAYNPTTRAYRPTARVALLGRSVAAPLVGDGLLVRLVERLNARSGLLVAVSARNQTDFQYIYVVQGKMPGRSFVVNGLKAPLTYSASGLVLLGQMESAEIKRIALRINVESDGRYRVPSISGLIERVEQVRKDGYALSLHSDSPTGTLAMILPRIGGADQLSIGIGASTKVLAARYQDLLEMMREEIVHFAELGSHLASDARLPVTRRDHAGSA